VQSTSELHFASYHTNTINYTVPTDDVELQSCWKESETVFFKVKKLYERFAYLIT